MHYSKALINKDDLRVFNSTLAAEIGVNEAIALQQIHYWLVINEKKENNFIDGRYWTYNTYTDWMKESFPFWSKSTVIRAMKGLKKQNLITTTSEYNKKDYDDTLWYTINYDILEEISEKIYNNTPSEQGGSQNEQGGSQNETPPNQDGTPPNQNDNTNTKDFTKNSKESNNNKKNKGQNFKIPKEIVDNFKAAFEKTPNTFQQKTIADYIENEMDVDLILETIKHCGLGGHNQSFFFRRLEILKRESILDKKTLFEYQKKAYIKNKGKSDSSENVDDIDKAYYDKWGDGMDFEAFKE